MNVINFFRHQYVLYVLMGLVVVMLIVETFYPAAKILLWVISTVAAIPTVIGAFGALIKKSINIDTFNTFALAVAFSTSEIRSAAFIILMLLSAELLDLKTEARARNAIRELLRLKPQKALIEKNEQIKEISVDKIKPGDVLVVETGSQIPVDGVVLFGHTLVNEAAVTGESMPVEKTISDRVLSTTINEMGVIKIRATRVGKESTIERMAALIEEAQKNKSQPEKMADRFAAIFLPIVIVIAAITYLLTKNIIMTASIFLVACADDMALSIPLAITASLGRAAKKGVIIKGGAWLDTLGKIKILLLDKTGTLTYGRFSLEKVDIEEDIDKKDFWEYVAIGEKFSEHPIGRSIFREALKYVKEVPDPEEFKVYKGLGVYAKYKNNEIVIGNKKIIPLFKIKLPKSKKGVIDNTEHDTSSIIFINKKLVGVINIADIPRPEARHSIEEMKKTGIEKIIMFTGDNEKVARKIAHEINIDEYRASMKPEDKLRELEKISQQGVVAMVGDGINDAPVLARADVGIAMGKGGTAVAVESADMVILNDNLLRIPQMIELGKKTKKVIHQDIWIWFFSNLIGFTLVLTGAFGLVLAAFYNFIADFFPLLNSARLFREPPH